MELAKIWRMMLGPIRRDKTHWYGVHTVSTFRYLPMALVLCIGAITTSTHAGVLEDVSAHTTKGRTVFLVLTDAVALNLSQARATARAAQQRTPNSAVIELNRSDPAQAAAVAKYRVAAAPVPLVLCVASTGVGVGAVRPTTKGAVARLVAMVPSPAKAEYQRVLSQRRVAAVVFSRATMREQRSLFAEISKMYGVRKLNMTPIFVDLDDVREANWIKTWNLNPKKIKRPLIVFVNPKGQIIGKLRGAPKASQIVQMSKKRVHGCQDPNCKDPNCRHHGR